MHVWQEIDYRMDMAHGELPEMASRKQSTDDNNIDDGDDNDDKKLKNTPTFRAYLSCKLLIIFSQYLTLFVFICCKYVSKYGARGDVVG
jgi:hypothetical protein